MQFISSDTSVWIDFATIDRLELPFRLPYRYLMSRYAVEDELLSPPVLGRKLIAYGLIPVEITIDEFLLAQEYGTQYAQLSTYDRLSLAVAKARGIILLTGDGALRKAAKREDVVIMGTLGILDQLYAEGQIDTEEFRRCLESLKAYNGGFVRLPKEELEKRLASLDRGLS